MTNHIEARRKLQQICEVEEFEQILKQCILTEDERTILRLHYLEGKILHTSEMRWAGRNRP